MYLIQQLARESWTWENSFSWTRTPLVSNFSTRKSYTFYLFHQSLSTWCLTLEVRVAEHLLHTPRTNILLITQNPLSKDSLPTSTAMSALTASGPRTLYCDLSFEFINCVVPASIQTISVLTEPAWLIWHFQSSVPGSKICMRTPYICVSTLTVVILIES